ncbi:hypothetical protein HispidOSU_022517 [Sigmodon hispidus]
MERRARGRPAPRPPWLLLRPGGGLRGAPGSPAHDTSPEPRNSFAGLGLRRGRPSRGAPDSATPQRAPRDTLGLSGGRPHCRRECGRRGTEDVTAGRASFVSRDPGLLRCLGVPAPGDWGRGARRGNPAEGNARRKDCTREAAERQKRLGGLGEGAGDRKVGCGMERALGVQ